MRMIPAFLSILLIVSGAAGKEKIFTGSTPAGAIVKTFLGIPLPDSVDFIRWKLVVHDNQYQLQCNYGIGRPNTNGFMNDGKKIELTGTLGNEKGDYQLQNGNHTLKIAKLNEDLLHLQDADNNLLVGNGGWSYTLNNVRPSGIDNVIMIAKQVVFKVQ